MRRKIWLQDMTWEEVEEAVKRTKGVILIPVGSIEQHARHLPLGTDSYCAIRVCVDAAKEADAVVAPPIWYGLEYSTYGLSRYCEYKSTGTNRLHS